MCTAAERVVAERGALGEAYRLAIRGDVAAAVEAARLSRVRLADVLVELRDLRVGRSREEARNAIRDDAQMLEDAASDIAKRGATEIDRDVILGQGRVVLPFIDELLRVDIPTDPVAAACPTFVSAFEPISFPPDRSNAELGLPDVVGDLLIETHVGHPDRWMTEALESAGIDPNRVRQIDATASDIDGGGAFISVLDGAAVPPAPFARMLQAELLPQGEPDAAERWAGFDVIVYRQIEDPSGSIHVATRGDRLIVFNDASDDVVRAFLEELP